MLELIGALLIGVLSGMIGTVSGGAGILTFPYFLFLGVPIEKVVALTRFGLIGMSFGAFKNFSDSKNIAWGLLIKLLVFASAGSLLGALSVVNINRDYLEIIAGVLLLMLIPLQFINKDLGIETKKTSSSKLIYGFIAVFGLMFYASLLGPGMGIMMLFVLTYFFGLTYLKSKGTSTILTALMSLVAVVVFALNNLILWDFAIVLFVGFMIGGYIGSLIAIKKGNQFVRLLVITMIIITSTKLLFF